MLNQTKKFHRKKNHREMLFRNLATSLFLYEKIITNKTKARALVSTAEKVINKAKSDRLINTRFVYDYLLDKNAAKKLFRVILPRLKDKTSGYFNRYDVGTFLGDGSPKTIVQFYDYKPVEKPKEIASEEATEPQKPVTKKDLNRAKKLEKLTKDQTRGEVKTIVRKKGERRISNEK